ncbi:peptide synthase like condensation domain [Cryptosporidium xiaoi]|uniref:Peptide synthase like condensation domain n=1 Tax=Cryptosporidium xiaoi TaxID=659607 RepID=A0AAV9XT69_9CRYT
MNLEGTTVVRSLDVVETFWEAFNVLGNVIILNPIIVRSSFPIKLEVVKEAAQRMAQRHQSLRVRIVSEMSGSDKKDKIKRYFVDLCNNVEVVVREDFKMKKGFTYTDSVESNVEFEDPIWEEILLKEQNDFFESERSPLWRINIMKLGKSEGTYRTCFVGSFHHAIMDGLSRQYFWTELLGLCLLSNEYQGISIPKIRQTTLPRSVCKYFPSSLKVKILEPFYSWRTTATHGVCLYRKLVGPFENPLSIEISRDLYADFKRSPRTSIYPIKIKSDVLKKLMAKCKERKTQLNGAIEAVSALALMDLIYELRKKRMKNDSGEISELKEIITINCNNSINGRNNSYDICDLNMTGEEIKKDEYLNYVNNCSTFCMNTSNECYIHGNNFNPIIPIRTMVAINCRRWVSKDNPSIAPETSKVVESDLINILESIQNNNFSETATTSTITEKNDDLVFKVDSPNEVLSTPSLNTADENLSSLENIEYSDLFRDKENKSQNSKEYFNNLPKLTQFQKIRQSQPNTDKISPSWLKKAVSKVISPSNKRLKEMKTVGLGSYAVLMGLDMKVERNCMNDVEKIWELAINTSKKIHSIVDSKDPSAVTFEWHVISGKFIINIKTR